MSQMVGADVAELRDLAASFDNKAAALRTMESQLAGRIPSAPWHGSDVQYFQHNWNSVHRRTILNSATAIANAAQVLRANAEQQEIASDAAFAGRVPTVGQLRQAEAQRVQEAGRGGVSWGVVAGAFGAAFMKVLDVAHGVGKKVEGAAKTYIKGRAALTSIGRWATSDGPAALLKRVVRATKGVKQGSLFKAVETGFGRVLLPLGTVLSAVDLVDDVRAGDAGGAVFSGGSVVLGALGTAVVFGAITGPAAPVILAAAGVWAAASLAYDHRETIMKAGSWVADRVADGVKAVGDGVKSAVGQARKTVDDIKDAAAGAIGRLTNPLRSVFG